MRLINSYPRSGSAKLRFIICYLLYPEFTGSFSQMSRLTPSIDNPDTRNDGLASDFMVTHSCIDSDIYLYRHVGDCLVSEYYFKQKFYPSAETLHDFIVASNYGEEWRRSVEKGRSAKVKLSFDDLNSPEALWKANLVNGATFDDYAEAINKASFYRMQKAEDKDSFYYLPDNNSKIKYMRNGRSGQWKSLRSAKDICRANESELLYLNLMKYEPELDDFIDIR